MRCPMKFASSENSDFNCDQDCAWSVEFIPGKLSCAIAVLASEESSIKSKEMNDDE